MLYFYLVQTWERYIKQFASFLKVDKGLSANTAEAYISDVRRLAEYCTSTQLAPEEVTQQDLSLFIGELFDLGLSEASQARIITGIRQFYVFLVLEDYIQTDPAALLKMPRKGRKLPSVLSLQEIDAMIEAIDLNSDQAYRNRAILETLYSCGLRVSELVNLSYSECFFDEGFIRVVGKGNKQRLVPVSGAVIEAIELYEEYERGRVDAKPGEENVVFLNRRGRRLTREMIFTIIKKLALDVGIKKKVSPHTFRHSFATHMLEQGANLRAIQEMLGHESITTTEIYAHLNEKMVRDAVLNFHPRNKV